MRKDELNWNSNELHPMFAENTEDSHKQPLSYFAFCEEMFCVTFIIILQGEAGRRIW